ncbi:MAG: aspartate aminotransferase family protein [Turicibacter sp.]|nr:aspartate aminotransferase family protein [Turicibacter sp.]
MFLGAERVIEMRREYMLPCLNFFYKNPPQFVRGEMQYLYDETGKKYLDFFAGVSVMNCGHSNPFILDRVVEQLYKLQHVTNIYLTQPIVELAQKMSTMLPGNICSSFFCMSGSEAVEGAMLLARCVTNKRKFIALNGSLHGRTHMSMSATNIAMWRTDPFLSDDIIFIDSNIEALNAALKIGDIAGFIAEPIQGNAGIITPPDDFFIQVKKILAENNVLMLIDEVQTGFARSGKLFCIETYGVVPDIIAYAKAFGNGFPIAGFSATKELASQFTKPSASTLGGNPVSCAAAMAVLDYINDNELADKANKLGEYLRGKLLEMQKNHAIIKEIRGKGLMLGAEISTAEGLPNPEFVDTILERLKDNGIILGKNGIHRNVLAFQPPLVINQNDIDFLLEKLNSALT